MMQSNEPWTRDTNHALFAFQIIQNYAAFRLKWVEKICDFNHILDMDVMYLMGRPVLHVLDEATHLN